MVKRRSLFTIGEIGVVLVLMLIIIFKILSMCPVEHCKNRVWSIGVYECESPFKMSKTTKITNPVLTAADVNDVKALFVADPFMIKKDSTWYMFFEVLNALTNEGDIGMATSKDGHTWEYQCIVLDENYHLSYPYVFEYDGTIYMIPESGNAGKLCLYQAAGFPYKWELKKVLIEGSFGDHGLLRYNDTWWLFAGAQPYKNNVLNLYFADDLLGEWKEHPMSPIVKNNAHYARPGGRVMLIDDQIIRFTQDCDPAYGIEVNAFEICKLTKTDFIEQKCLSNPVLQKGVDRWNRQGMHHIDPHRLENGRWLACVDGFYKHIVISIDF